MSLSFAEVTIPTPGEGDGAEMMYQLWVNLHDKGYRATFEHKVGATGYLDQPVQMEDSMAVGVDEHGRRFITLRVLRKGRGEASVVTVFQRYTGDNSVWTLARNEGYDPGLVGSAVTPDEARTIRTLCVTGYAQAEHERWNREANDYEKFRVEFSRVR